MNKHIISKLWVLLCFLIPSFSLEGQVRDTIEYYDADWESCTQENAAFYREIAYDENGKPAGKVRDYFISGALQFEGELMIIDREITFNKNCKWYYKNGQIKLDRNFQLGIPIGLIRHWDENGNKKKSYFNTQLERSLLLEALELQNENIDKDLLQVFLHLGQEYYEKGSAEDAYTFFGLCYDLALDLKDSILLHKSLTNIGTYYHRKLNQYKESLEIFSLAEGIQKETKIPKESLSAFFINYGSLLQTKGAYQKALSTYKKAKKLANQTDSNVLKITVLNNIGELFLETGNTDSAQVLLKEALVLSNDDIFEYERLILFNNLGRVEHHKGNFQEALTFYEQSKALAENNNLIIDYGKIINKIGEVYLEQGQLKLAKQHFLDALKIFEFEDLDKGYVLINLASLYGDLGEQKNASISWITAKNIFNQKGIAIGEIKAQNGLANLLAAQGKIEQAIAQYKISLSLSMEKGLESATASLQTNLGLLYLQIKDYEKAKTYLTEGIFLKEKLGFKTSLSVSQVNLAIALFNLGDINRSIQLLTKAMKLAHNQKDYPDLTYAYLQLGSMYYFLEKLPKSRYYLEECLKISQEIDLAPQASEALNNLALVAILEKDYPQAQKHLEAARKIQENLGLSFALFRTLNNLGYLYLTKGNHEKALTYFEAQLKLNEIQFSSSTGELSQLLVLSDAYHSVVGAIESLNAIKKNHPKSLFFLELQKSRTLTKLLKEVSIDLNLEIPIEIIHKEKAINENLNAINKQLIQTRDNTIRSNLIAERKNLLEDLKVLAAQIRDDLPLYSSIKYPKIAEVKDIQNILGFEEVLIEYLITEEEIFVAICQKNNYTFFSLGKSPNLKVVINDFKAKYLQVYKKALQRNNKIVLKSLEKKFHQHANLLYKLLWNPLEKTGLLKNKKIILIPDGILHYLPFELLVKDSIQKDYADYHYLIKDYPITYYPSATVLHFERTKKQKKEQPNKSFFGLGLQNFEDNHCYENTPINYGTLPNSVKEVQAIANLYPPSQQDILIDKQATEEQFKKTDLRQYKYLHLSTHGLINAEKPDFSKIVLNPAGQEDGCLNLYELFGLDLNADLVTLSACETGLGKLVRGEGIVGFTRGLMYAGTPSMILSLWEVEDKSTSELFVNYYTKLQNNKGQYKYQALRETQLEMIKNGGEYANPFYWAPFIFIGER